MGRLHQRGRLGARLLQGRLGMDVWLVTEVVDGLQRLIACHPAGAFAVGDALPWRESFCVRMVSGEGPRFAPVIAAVLVYAGLSEGPAARVAAYLGVPLLRPDGSLFGTVCGYGFRAQSPALARQLPIVELTARLLAARGAGLAPVGEPPAAERFRR